MQTPLNVLTLPLWWYTTGLSVMSGWLKRQTRYGLHKTGLVLFARHLREPLFGDYTKAGIIVGFFLRIILLLYKAIYFSLREVLVTAWFLLYLAALPLSVLLLVRQLIPVG